MSETQAEYDLVGTMMAYECDQLDGNSTIEFFQHLIDSGLAWKLQGHYGWPDENSICVSSGF